MVALPDRLHQQLLESFGVDEARVHEECGGTLILLQHLQDVTERRFGVRNIVDRKQCSVDVIFIDYIVCPREQSEEKLQLIASSV